MFLIEYSSTRTAKEAWGIQRIGFVRDHKMILKILAFEEHPINRSRAAEIEQYSIITRTTFAHWAFPGSPNTEATSMI
jgi:hypothetical protein